MAQWMSRYSKAVPSRWASVAVHRRWAWLLRRLGLEVYE